MRVAHKHIHILVIAALGLSASAAMAANANNGAQLAKRWCASCHVVDRDQKQARADVRPFAAIARKPDFTPEKVAFFLLDPHPKMPEFPAESERGSRYCRLHRIASQIARAAILRRKFGVGYVNAIRMKGPILHIFGFTKP
jgi:hypothetical protein